LAGVAFFLEVGLLLVVLPWSSFWDNNYFASLWPGLREVVTNRDGAVICLVTDRHRLIADPADLEAAVRALTRQAREAAQAGIDLIQVREPGIEAGSLAEIVGAVVDAVRGSTTRVVVNDRLDVALACGADGVHLRGDSMSPAAVGSIVPDGFLIGRSVHRVEEARQLEPLVDYVIAGTVFPTVSKPSGDAWLGTDGLRAMVRATADHGAAVLAIGGMSLDCLASVASTGVAGIAAIGLFLPGAWPMARLVQTVRERFDTVTAPS
jgi:thiamine-phosphate pyrophosphorylase